MARVLLKLNILYSGTAYVKIDGNRRISIFKEDDLHVWAVFTDMSVKKGWNDSLHQPENIQNDTTKSYKEIG